ncbi:hypothetical protein GQ42DRAFT_116488 [Ramicandelaber brevisporus]|nr:hypothetical protein GQ42DRAFT_116488 [Ramicandelaber brevisporus]
MSASGFFGLKISPSTTYSHVVDIPIHITQACFGEDVETSEKRTVIYAVVNKHEVAICTLVPGQQESIKLDIVFSEGEEVSFKSSGKSAVYISGNYIIDLDEESMEGYDGEEYDEEDEDGLEWDSDDEDLDMSDDDSEIDSDEELLLEEVRKRKATESPAKKTAETPSKADKKQQQQQQQQNKKQKTNNGEPASPSTPKDAKKDQAKDAKSPASEQKKKDETPSKKTLAGGLVVEERKAGTGKAAGKGDRIGMYYVGRLKTNGKVFDKCTGGKPFWFSLGKGEVIKGWDQGIAGMKVGGERRLTIPAPLAYGRQGAPPDIPGNATLEFDVKMIEIKSKH